jgi:hypothetical protein
MLTKDKAIEKLQQQVNDISKIKTPADFKKWRRDTEIVIEKVFTQETRHSKDFSDSFFSLDLGISYSSPSEFLQVFVKGIEESRAVLNSLIQEVEDFYDDDVVPVERNDLVIIEKFCSRFHLAARQLRSRHDARETIDIKDEYDVQDLFHALLTLEFNDIRPEEWTPSYAGGASRVDFLLKQEQIVVEIKKTRKDLKAKDIGEQLIVDIGRYKIHPDCKTLICFVYDPDGWIANPRGIENDLNGEHEGVGVKVIIAPRNV